MNVRGPEWREFNDLARENDILRAELAETREKLAFYQRCLQVTSDAIESMSTFIDSDVRWTVALERLMADIRRMP